MSNRGGMRQRYKLSMEIEAHSMEDLVDLFSSFEQELRRRGERTDARSEGLISGGFVKVVMDGVAS